MLKIYRQTRSRTFRVLSLCKESNIPFEQKPISIHVPDAQCKEEWYVKLNPNARIPTIDDDGFVMWELGAINLYLAKKYKSPLWPDTPQGEGNMLQWAFYVANDIEPPMITVFQNRFVFPPERRDAALAKQADKVLRPSQGARRSPQRAQVFRRCPLGHGRLHGGERDLEPGADKVRSLGFPQTGELAEGEPRSARSSGTLKLRAA